MPLEHSKSKAAFVHNLKAEMRAGKPQDQALAIAYHQKRKKKAMGGYADDADAKEEKETGYQEMPADYTRMAHGGQITDNYQSKAYGRGQTHPDLKDHEKDKGYVTHEGNVQRPDAMAIEEDDRDLNQHGEMEQGPYGMAMADGGQITDNYQPLDGYLDMVGRIMAKRQQHFSEGGRVANETPITAGYKPNEFDDLVLRDHLESTYGHDDNAGDALGNAREDEDRHDIVQRLMRQRKMKSTNPRPA